MSTRTRDLNRTGRLAGLRVKWRFPNAYLRRPRFTMTSEWPDHPVRLTAGQDYLRTADDSGPRHYVYELLVVGNNEGLVRASRGVGFPQSACPFADECTSLLALAGGPSRDRSCQLSRDLISRDVVHNEDDTGLSIIGTGRQQVSPRERLCCRGREATVFV